MKIIIADDSNVTNMSKMFRNSEFNGDISNWDVSNVTNMDFMFYQNDVFNQDLSDWDVSNVIKKEHIFKDCNINEEYKPIF